MKTQENKTHTQAHIYTTTLEEKEQQIYLTLENMKKNYVAYKTLKNNETEALFGRSEAQLQKLNADIFKLENEIQNTNELYKNDNTEKEALLERYKKTITMLQKDLDTRRANGNASIPRHKEYDFIEKQIKTNITFHIIGSGILLYILWKHIRD